MKYFDITLKTPNHNDMSAIARRVHGTIKRSGHKYAMGMPTQKNAPYTFNVLRIFSDSNETVLTFLKLFNKDDKIDISDVVDVPNDYHGEIVQYRYYSLQEPDGKTKNFKFHQALFEARVEVAESFHYFKYKHANRGGEFNSKHFEEFHDVGGLNAFDPNNYGLSSKMKQAWLPLVYL